MPSSNGGVDGDGEEGVDVVGVVGAKGINTVFSFTLCNNFKTWIWKYYFLTNMHLFTIESHCALLISHNHFQGRLIHCCWLFRLIRLRCILKFLCVILKNFIMQVVCSSDCSHLQVIWNICNNSKVRIATVKHSSDFRFLPIGNLEGSGHW